MEAKETDLSEWQRILMGEVPGEFYAEVVLRTIAIFVILMVSMHLIGKKIASQLGQSEMIATISLAAAIGIPLQSPDRGLLPAVIIAAIVVLTQRGIGIRITASEKFERLTQDDISTLVTDGICGLRAMKKARITPERMRAQLRTKGIRHLGEVKRLYLEASGSFTLLKNESPLPGLCILPEWDPGFRERVCTATGHYACCHCGKVYERPVPEGARCEACGWKYFDTAVL